MAEAVKNIGWKPRIIKISPKRQITIPLDIYRTAGFADYALATWAENGITIQPIDVRSEDDTVRILRSLLAQGYDGEALIDEYERITRPLVDYKSAIDQGLEDIEQGRVAPFRETQDKLKKKYGL